jgi:hypothetical protein
VGDQERAAGEHNRAEADREAEKRETGDQGDALAHGPTVLQLARETCGDPTT